LHRCMAFFMTAAIVSGVPAFAHRSIRGCEKCGLASLHISSRKFHGSLGCALMVISQTIYDLPANQV
jgi:hypothetical protein